MIHIISLGGSLIVPNQNINWQYLKKFRQFILSRVNLGDKFFLITGGGQTCRRYQQAANRVVAKISSDNLDQLGIYATHLNAYLLRTILFDVADTRIITNPKQVFKTVKSVIVSAGWKPGNSTDYIAVLLAKKYKVKTVINLSNIDHVYNQDPKKNKEAKVIKQISWTDFRRLVGNQWQPGLNAPFDPIASVIAHKLKLKVIVTNGHKLKNLEKYFQTGKISGTIIN